MAGGKKNQKKRRKKNWKAVLEGCFHKPSFGRSSESQEQQKASRVTSEGACVSGVPASHQIEVREDEQVEEPTDRRHLRGILKKSSTLRHHDYPGYREAAVDVPSSLLNPQDPDWPQRRPAYLIHGQHESEEPGPSHSVQYQDLSTQQQNDSQLNSSYSGATPLYAQVNRSRKSRRPDRRHSYHSSDNRDDSDSGLIPRSPARFHDGYDHGLIRSFQDPNPNSDPYCLSYEALKHRLRLRSQGQLRDRQQQQPPAPPPRLPRRPVAPFPYEEASVEVHPQPAEVSVKTYTATKPQLRRHDQDRNPNRPVSAPPSSWHGASIAAASEKRRPASVIAKLDNRERSAFRRPKSETRSVNDSRSDSFSDSTVALYKPMGYHQPEPSRYVRPKSPTRSVNESRSDSFNDSAVALYKPIGCYQPEPNRYVRPKSPTRSVNDSRTECFSDSTISLYRPIGYPQHPEGNKYIVGACPRSRDPIRKPMGSQYCPYSNPLYQSMLTDQSRPVSSCSEFSKPYTTASEYSLDQSLESVGTESLTNQSLEVSHIYATVTRSRTMTSSSYVYASISWKKGKCQVDPVAPPPPSSGAPSPASSPPPIPPRRWGRHFIPVCGDQDDDVRSVRTDTDIRGRPPLPTYDEVIQSRIRRGRERPVSWSEYSHEKETERKREAFMQLLAQRYPQYADKIQGKAPPPGGSQQATLEKPARSRDGQRRRTAVVTYDPHQASNTLEYDDLGTMSDLELPSFQRGGFMRTSLPIVRSASTSLERPLGLVFLVSGDQTKRALLPNEITTLDTVRALFVRAFPDLTLEMLESPRRKIYILDPATSIYFQLEDLAEIKDRSVLKIHETDSDEPQKVKERQEIRGRTVQMPTSRPHSRQGYAEVPAGPTEVFSKSASLPPQAAHVYSDMMQDQRMPYEVDRRSRSRTPEPAERPRSLSAGASSRQRYSHSPDRLPTPERGLSLNPIPENRQLTPGYREQPPGFYDPAYRGGPAYPNAIYDAPGAYQGYAPSSPAPQGQAYVARSTRAAPLAHPQRAVAPASDMREPGVRGSNRHSLAFAPMSPASAAGDQGGFQRTQSYRQPPTERDGVELARSHSVTPADDMTRNRIEKMEAQLASLTAWVHYQKADPAPRDVTPPPRSLGSITSTSDSSDTFPASSASSLSSDIPDGPHHLHTHRSSGESTPLSAQAEVGAKLAQLKSDLQVLRRQQQLNMEAVRDELSNTFAQIKSVLSCVPGAENQVNVHKRVGALQVKTTYLSDKQQVDKELGDLEASVEELRTDVISRQCRVNNADVEGMALLLSNITKNLADLKARFPEIHEQMKEVMDSELRLVVSEEKFLKEEPNEIENSLKRCKKLTGTLYTLKRLASVQDHRPPQVPNMAAAPVQEVPDADPKSAVLENIKALVPDHDQRVQHMEAAEAARERKKKISTQQEALKFGKSLEMASKNLRPPSAAGDRITEGVSDVPVSQVTTSHPSVSKPAVPSKPSSLTAYSSSSSAPTYSSAASTSSLPSASTATVTTAASVTTAPSVSCPKPSFTAALTSTGKTTDKPTATVSAMTSANTPATNTVSTIAASQHGPSVVRAVSLPLTETTGRLSSNVQSGTGAVTHTVKVGTETGHKSDMSVSTFPTVSPSSPVKPPVFTKPGNLVKSPTREKPLSVTFSDKPSSEGVQLRPKTEVSKSVASTVTTAVAEAGPTARVSPPNGDVRASQKEVNGHPDDLPTVEKVDLATQKQAARSAFFSSMNTPPTSPDMHSPNRNSALLDPSPVVRPGPVATVNAGGVVGKVTPGPTINLVLSGTASPKSPTNPGSFSISPPKDLASPPPPNSNTTTITSSSKTVTSPLSSPSRSSIPMLVADKSDDPPPPPPPLSSTELLSVDTSAAGEVTMRHKKVPPPPPPRKGSRPTSANLSPVNGGLSSTVLRPQSEETPPRFVGGVLGQHRLSGGPLSSTPKPIPQQNPLSKFEKDIATGLYANLNRPDLQNQKSSPQHMLSEAKAPAIQAQSDSKRDSTLSRNSRGSIRNSKVGIDEYPMPPPPHMTMALDREERGSSSESTSSSSGTSMGSQQSVVSVVRSASNAQAPANKPKPEPPRRHSSLLAKFTGSRDSKSSINNGKANVNGVDL